VPSAPAWPSAAVDRRRGSPRTASHCPTRACRSADRTHSDWPARRNARAVYAPGPERSWSPRSWGCPTTLRAADNRRTQTPRPCRTGSLPRAPWAWPSRRGSSSTPKWPGISAPPCALPGSRHRCVRSRIPAAGRSQPPLPSQDIVAFGRTPNSIQRNRTNTSVAIEIRLVKAIGKEENPRCLVVRSGNAAAEKRKIGKVD